jgi:hypothetical protein
MEHTLSKETIRNHMVTVVLESIARLKTDAIDPEAIVDALINSGCMELYATAKFSSVNHPLLRELLKPWIKCDRLNSSWKIEAIKQARNLVTNLSLKEAKELVESVDFEERLKTSSDEFEHSDSNFRGGAWSGD